MGKRTTQLYTIGYAGFTPDQFVEALRAKRISMLLDVRMTPISRKRGFSKTALHDALDQAGISYQHMRMLGSPKELREDLNASGDYDTFFDKYRDYLMSQEEGLQQAAHLALLQSVCLMCVEQCPKECHRSVVADALSTMLGNRVTVHHLPAPTPMPITKTAKAVLH